MSEPISSFQMESLFPKVLKHQAFFLTKYFVQFIEGTLDPDDLRRLLKEALQDEDRVERLNLIQIMGPDAKPLGQIISERRVEKCEPTPADEHESHPGCA